LNAARTQDEAVSTPQTAVPHAGHLPKQVGTYLIAPLTHALHNGWFASSVSIRSGAGAGFSERILRITRLFRDRRTAAEFALREALQWIGAPHSLPAA
jgi:hypothetical protein